jgi:hypothetical protein
MRADPFLFFSSSGGSQSLHRTCTDLSYRELNRIYGRSPVKARQVAFLRREDEDDAACFFLSSVLAYSG